MKKNLTISFVLLATLFSTICLVPVNGKAADSKSAGEAAVTAPVYTAAETKEFKALAKATIEALAAGGSGKGLVLCACGKASWTRGS